MAANIYFPTDSSGSLRTGSSALLVRAITPVGMMVGAEAGVRRSRRWSRTLRFRGGFPADARSTSPETALYVSETGIKSYRVFDIVNRHDARLGQFDPSRRSGKDLSKC